MGHSSDHWDHLYIMFTHHIKLYYLVLIKTDYPFKELLTLQAISLFCVVMETFSVQKNVSARYVESTFNMDSTWSLLTAARQKKIKMIQAVHEKMTGNLKLTKKYG